MIRSFLIDFVLPVLLYMVVRAVFRNAFSVFRGPPRSSAPTRPQQQAPPVTAGGELRKDPVCGTYVSTATSVSSIVNGKVVYFCSKDCRDRYRG